MNVERRTKRKPSCIWLVLILIDVAVLGFRFYFVSQQNRQKHIQKREPGFGGEEKDGSQTR